MSRRKPGEPPKLRRYRGEWRFGTSASFIVDNPDTGLTMETTRATVPFGVAHPYKSFRWMLRLAVKSGHHWTNLYILYGPDRGRRI